MNLETYAKNTWCPGCGNFGILNAVKNVIKEFGDYRKFVLVSGIGCHAKIVDYVNVNSFYSIHGRVPSTASGIKLGNPDLKVIGFAGDGDAYGEGLEHLIFAAKRNIDITMIIHNNRLYALTTGQFSPTSPYGFRGRSTPKGTVEEPLNPIKLMLVSGATFVARSFAGDLKHLQDIIKKAVEHKGFSIVDVLQPCITFFNTYDFYMKNIYKLDDHDPSDIKKALKKADEWNYVDGGKIPIGIFYKTEKPTYDELILRGRNPSKM